MSLMSGFDTASASLSYPFHPGLAKLVPAQRIRQEARLELRAETLLGDWERLLTRANAPGGDGLAFGQFLRLVTPTLRAVIRAKAGAIPPDQHEDILQDVLLAIHLKRHTWRPDTPVRPWLYAVARYKVIDAHRRRGSTVHLPIEDFDDILPEAAPTVPLSTRDADRMLGMIDARGAALVRAVALNGESTEEAGRSLGLNAGAARVALHRAMKRLMQIAERMGK